MEKIKNVAITSYYTGHEDFIIDIVETDNGYDDTMYETWLYREKTGTKIFVVGEYKKNYKGKTIDQYAKHMIQYIKIVWKSSLNFYGIYDEEIEDIELAAWERIKKEKGI